MDSTTIIDTTTSSQSSAVFYGLIGAASGLILSSISAAYGSSKPNIFHSQSSSSTNKQLPEWENADSSTSSFKNQNKCKLSGIIPFIPMMIAGVLSWASCNSKKEDLTEEILQYLEESSIVAVRSSARYSKINISLLVVEERCT